MYVTRSIIYLVSVIINICRVSVSNPNMPSIEYQYRPFTNNCINYLLSCILLDKNINFDNIKFCLQFWGLPSPMVSSRINHSCSVNKLLQTISMPLREENSAEHFQHKSGKYLQYIYVSETFSLTLKKL